MFTKEELKKLMIRYWTTFTITLIIFEVIKFTLFHTL